jgi:hypothetical protein
MTFLAVSLWGAIMMGAIFYTQEARHRDLPPLAAYLIFMTAFSTAGIVVFASLSLLVEALDVVPHLEHPLAAIAFQAAVFLPAILVGRRLIRKAPRRAPLPDGGEGQRPV